MKRLVLVLVLAACLAALPPTALCASDRPTAAARAEPATVAFGDPLLLTVEVTLPAGSAEGASVIADPSPFTALGPASVERVSTDAGTVVVVRQRVACLDRGCLPGAQGRSVTTPAVRVRLGGEVVIVEGSSASVRVEPRVQLDAVRAGEGGYRADATLAPPTTSIRPAALALLLLAAALVLAAAAVALLWPDVRRARRARAASAGVDALTRALLLLRESAARPAGDRRRAADLVGRLVGRGGDPARADHAIRLAWSRPEPDPADAVGLADAVERSRGGR